MKSPEKINMEFDQQKHPEIQEGERFIGNASISDIKEYNYNSKRIGSIAYDNDGNVMKGFSPIFVLKKEYEEKQREYEELGKEKKDEKNEDEIILTEEILSKARMEGKIKNPEALSWRDKEYQEYANHLTISDVESLCEILQYSKEEIFTEENIGPINHYGEINLEGKKYSIGSGNVQDILLLIRDGEWDKNDVLYDVSLLLNSKKYPEHSDIEVSIANRLFQEGYIEIDKDWLKEKIKL